MLYRDSESVAKNEAPRHPPPTNTAGPNTSGLTNKNYIMKTAIKQIAITAFIAISVGMTFTSCASKVHRDYRQDGRQDNRDDHQDNRGDNQDDRQDNRKDRW